MNQSCPQTFMLSHHLQAAVWWETQQCIGIPKDHQPIPKPMYLLCFLQLFSFSQCSNGC